MQKWARQSRGLEKHPEHHRVILHIPSRALCASGVLVVPSIKELL
jgi:hypothetical protein